MPVSLNTIDFFKAVRVAIYSGLCYFGTMLVHKKYVDEIVETTSATKELALGIAIGTLGYIILRKLQK